VDDCFLARPKGATHSIQYCVKGLDKGVTIACNPRFGLLCTHQTYVAGVLDVPEYP